MLDGRNLTDAERLAALAEWFAYAAEDDLAPDQRVERVAFITAELDAMLTGFRRSSDALVAITDPIPLPVSPRHRFRVVR